MGTVRDLQLELDYTKKLCLLETAILQLNVDIWFGKLLSKLEVASIVLGSSN